MNTQDLASQIDQLTEEYVNKRDTVALTIGVIQHDRHSIKGFGNLTPNGHTLYEIGSITKVFTGTILAAFVNENTVLLDDAIRLYLPAAVVQQLPAAIQAITLRQLVTHTSGIPRLPDAFLNTIEDPTNPYAHYTAEQLYPDLAQITLLNPPGEHYEYSNFGMGLLGHLLSLKASQPYETLVKQIICQPLGMTDTTIALTPEQQQQLATGHSPDGTVVPNWTFDVMAPAGAFRSTAQDLLKFLQANLHQTNSPLSKALARSQERSFEATLHLHLGLAWHISIGRNGEILYWHNGGTGGYVSFMGFNPAQQTGVVVLSNSGDAFALDTSVDDMGFKLLLECLIS